MRLRSDRKIFLSYLVLIAGLTIAVSAGAEAALRTYLLRTVEDDLSRELALAAELFERLRGMPADSVADLLAERTGRRVTIVAPDGVAVGESAPEAEEGPPGQGYLARPEVRMALESGFGRAIRYSQTLSIDFLYLARPAAGNHVIRFAVPLAQLEASLSNVRRRILLIGLITVPVAILFSYVFAAVVTQPLRRTVEVARALGTGDLSRRVQIRRNDEVGEVGTALNTLADELQRRLGQLEGERAEMQALIDTMSEGVLALGRNGTVRRANPAARRMFGVTRAEGMSPEMVSRRPEFLGMVTRALRGETVPATELTGDGRLLIGTAHPLPQGGAVLVFLDISQLRRLEGVRRDFVANASHELKTPLTAIRGYAETLLDPDLPPELTRRFAAVLKRNSDRLQRLVDDLLDLSRIEAGAWRIEPANVGIASLAQEAWVSQAASADGKDVRLEFDLAPGRESVRADPGALMQILANLFNNALRYTPSGGTITVRTRAGTGRERGETANGVTYAGEMTGGQAGTGGYEASVESGSEGGARATVDRSEQSGQRLASRPAGPTAPSMPLAVPGASSSLDRDGDWTIVEVADTGSGIPRTHLSRIFERFYRVDPARSREEGGTGLGLAIVKHLVEAHGGWIEAESEVGHGTTIRFTLPHAEGRKP